MAVFIRCSCFFTRPGSVRSAPPSDHILGKPHLPGNLSSLPFRVEKVASPSDDVSSGKLGIHHLLPGSKVISSRFKTSKKSEGSWDISKMPVMHVKLLERVSALEGNQKLRFLTMAFLFTNSFMLSAPLEALAETCEAENSFFNMPLLLFVALIGATVGGLLARQRRGELARLNEQLRQINAALRRQAKIESYAPSLSYAPVGGKIPDSEVIVDPRKQELISRLKAGKNFLRNQEPDKAFEEFKTAFELAQNVKDPTEEKKAARGLGASLQRQGKYWEAIKYHLMVLKISEREGEDSGNTEAFGAIADCYTELGELEKAGKFYDKYIARLESD